MTTAGNPNTAWRCAPALGLALAIALASATPASAGDTALEYAQLASLIRQLDMLEGTAHQSASLVRYERTRYHFDYARLQQDIKRIRQGIHDYMTPPRAQPRDPIELLGDYNQSNLSNDDKEAQ